MLTYDNFELFEQMEDLDSLPPIRNISDKHLQHRRPKDKVNREKESFDTSLLEKQENEFNFSFGASKHEKVWINDSLKDFYQQNWFEDILRLIKGGGKEASVYQCLGNTTTQHKYIAAKVYRP
ncbi:MAG TPA: hypothetical protein DCL08_05150 [Anaerolineaceae bacterium]|nr:hypothetical protein [Anaerolineaceae bacterium]